MTANETILNDFIAKHPFAAARAMELLPNAEVTSYLEKLPWGKSAALFSFMNKDKATECFALLTTDKSEELLEKADTSLLAALLKPLDSLQRERLLNTISRDRALEIALQLEVLPNTVASIMETALLATQNVTVEHVFKLFKNEPSSNESYLYVVDQEGIFFGIVRAKELFLANRDDTIHDLTIKNIQGFPKDTPVKSILEHPVWMEYQEVPILDSSGKILGKLPYRTILKFTSSPGRTSISEINETGSAIGELYRIGLTGLLQGGGK